MSISIHAPREGGDEFAANLLDLTTISIHAPREGGDADLFGGGTWERNFNPRPPRGGRQYFVCYTLMQEVFQSTPPARGATHGDKVLILPHVKFQSTPPARGATSRKVENHE